VIIAELTVYRFSTLKTPLEKQQALPVTLQFSLSILASLSALLSTSIFLNTATPPTTSASAQTPSRFTPSVCQERKMKSEIAQ
jgi:hypothetical protein